MPRSSSPSSVGPVDKTASRNRCLSYISESRKQLTADKPMAAYQLMNLALGYAVEADLKNQVNQLGQALEAVGGKMLSEADKLFAEQQYLEALRVYRVVSTMGKLKVGATAKARLNMAEQHPGCAAVMRNVKAAMIYSTIHGILQCSIDDPEEGGAVKQDSLDDGGSGVGSDEADVEAHAKRAFKAPLADQVRLMTTLDQVITTYEGTPSAKLAEQLRDRLNADTAFASLIEKQKKDDVLRHGFEWAQQNERSGFTDKAIEAYKKVIADGPKTDWAIKAKLKIESIERDEKLKALTR
ncbi:MAG: hypothetical protein FWD53_02185 [Phycisphaerales bacterium]|nr:hypothetical protein [Phycisphaerales bacterium]